MTNRWLIAALVVSATTVQAADPPPESPGRDTVRGVVKAAVEGSRPPDASRVPDPSVDRWLQANAESIDGVRPGPLKDLPWGYSTFRPAADAKPARLYLHVFEWHAGGKLIVYGLTGGVRRAQLLHDAADLPVVKTERAVIVTVPKQAPDPIDTVVVLELEGEPKTVGLAVQPDADGRIVLHAKDVIVHGRTVRYEPEPHKNTVGYWMDPADWVRWEFEVKKPGACDVDILQGCGKGSGGSTVDFSAAGQTLTVTVQDTGGFQNFVSRRIGQFTFEKPGTYTLTVKPTHKPGVAVMDLRSVTLTPAAP